MRKLLGRKSKGRELFWKKGRILLGTAECAALNTRGERAGEKTNKVSFGGGQCVHLTEKDDIKNPF